MSRITLTLKKQFTASPITSETEKFMRTTYVFGNEFWDFYYAQKPIVQDKIDWVIGLVGSQVNSDKLPGAEVTPFKKVSPLFYNFSSCQF